jgi:hypothetical protein
MLTIPQSGFPSNELQRLRKHGENPSVLDLFSRKLIPSGSWISMIVCLSEVGLLMRCKFVNCSPAVQSKCPDQGRGSIYSEAANRRRIHARTPRLTLSSTTPAASLLLQGINAQGSLTNDFTPVLPALVQTYFPPDGSHITETDWTEAPVPEWRGIEDDQELIRRAMQSRTVASAFGNKASFADLFLADEKVLGRCFPDPARPFDNSMADGALAQHLAFWTGKNCERIERLMNMSKLVREKWDRPDGQYGTYLRRTILGCVARQIDVFQSQTPPAAASPSLSVPSGTGDVVSGMRMMGLQPQQELFKGIIYVTDTHRVLIPGGHILKPEQFKVHYGGYTFQMDFGNERTTRDSWEAFTQSQMLRPPMVNGTCFRPDLPAGEIVARNGLSFVNTYVPVDVPRKEGDASPFLTHLARVLPDPTDQAILLSFMAAVVQHKGVKFQWAPLLQGVEGKREDSVYSLCG